MKCLNCQNEEATFKDGIGWTQGINCLNRQAGFPKPSVPAEFTTEEIKTSRIVHEEDIVQPFRDGVVSKEYLDIHGTKGIAVSETELAQADYVWNDSEDVYYKKHK